MIRKALKNLEDSWTRSKNRVLIKHFGYKLAIIPYTSIGSETSLLIQLRVLLVRKAKINHVLSRGFRSFFTSQAPGANIDVMLPGENVGCRLTTDRGGYVIKQVNHNLKPGWHKLTIKLATTYVIGHRNKKKVVRSSLPSDFGIASTNALIVSQNDATGIICDVDDTVLVSNVPSKLTALKNLLFASPFKRSVVKGMPKLLDSLLEKYQNSFIVYLSAGPWNQYGFLKRFITTNKLPFGPLILQDIGPDDTKVFESTKLHKHNRIEDLLSLFPNVKWLLIGDDGQHDVEIYQRIANLHPTRIKAILIRQLTAVQHAMVSVLPFSLQATPKNNSTPTIMAPNGDELLRAFEASSISLG
ncbi:MAG: DUF2183 domain-containing protein [Candidatus Ancillula sp.]|jgi:phosphatidate phosphatase APP1|nr:DUF2183 domain-containing protein [Candidatus Ancillula sp.]